MLWLLLYGCGIDNCVIELSGEEFPILDGSARYYVEEIQKVGIEEQQAERRYFSVKKKMEFYCEASDTRITLLPDDTYSINQQSLIEDEDSDRFEFAYDMKQIVSRDTFDPRRYESSFSDVRCRI